FAIFTTGGNGTVVQYRTTAGGNTSQVSGVAGGAPIYVRVTRAGTTYTAYTSTDGSTWTAFPGGSVTIAALSGTIDAGMAATSHTNTDQWAKAGILIRQSTGSGSSYALLSVSPGNGITFQHGNNTSVSGGGYTFPGAWLRLTRSGAALTAYASADGATWTTAGTATDGFTDPVLAGLAVGSHDPGAVTTATFRHVTVGP